MPNISLVVCLYKERDLLERLLQQAEGCYDDLVVVHDGVEECVPIEDIGGRRSIQSSSLINPSSVINHQSQCYEDGWKSPEDLSLKEPDAPPIEIARDYAGLPKGAPIPTGYRLKTGLPQPGSIHELVVQHGGSFYEGPRCYQQEPHWPFAWWAAKHDWILRLDADEYPDNELSEWVRSFRLLEDDIKTPGYLCVWPQWDGYKQVLATKPGCRLFLLNKSYAAFFGMVEHVAHTSTTPVPISLTLEHRPTRKSYGIRNVLFRHQAYRWRWVIARSLLRSPLHLPRWNYTSSQWPLGWVYRYNHPLRASARAFSVGLWQDLIFLRAHNLSIVLSVVLGTAFHQAAMCLTILFVRLSARFRK